MSEKSTKTNEIPSRVKEIATAIGLSRKDLSIRIGIPESTVGDYLYRGKEPSVKFVASLISEFGISPDYILFGEGPMTRQPQNTKTGPINGTGTIISSPNATQVNYTSINFGGIHTSYNNTTNPSSSPNTPATHPQSPESLSGQQIISTQRETIQSLQEQLKRSTAQNISLQNQCERLTQTILQQTQTISTLTTTLCTQQQ